MSDNYEQPFFERPRDRQIDVAKGVLIERFFPDDGTTVYYGRQLEVALEREFFHWITKRALNELAEERTINFAEEKTDHHVAHFYWPRRHRYPRRQIRDTLALIKEFSDPTFTRALGSQAELLLDAGFARIGFRVLASNVREHGEIKWLNTDHNLDRIIERDGLAYGVEVKNQLAYIDQTEFQIKLQMCEHLDLRPLFVARMMPKNYIQTVVQAGGFSLLFGNQHYPLLADELAKRVRDRLGLPILCIRELPDTTLKRFERWHVGQLEKRQRG